MMLRSMLLGVCAFALVMAVAEAGSAATVYDLATDYSTTINTSSSTWSYRTGASRNGSYTLLNLAPGAGGGFAGPFSPGASPSVMQGWQLSGSPTVPFVGKNATGGTETFLSGGSFVWPNGEVMAHPTTGGLVIFSWLAPANGTADINYQFADAHLGGGPVSGIVFSVDRNAGIGVDQLDTDLVPEAGNSGPLQLTGISVLAGDRINFVIDLQSELNANATFVDATISFEAALPAPEPSSLWLAGCGLLTLARVQRRTRMAS